MQIEIINDRLVPYDEAMRWFDGINQAKQNNEKIIIFEHQDIYTCGKSVNNKEINTINGIRTIKTQRGGLWTWHGKGQVMIYFILNLRQRKITLADWFSVIEPTIISCIENDIINNAGISENKLHEILQVYADEKKRGFWVKNKKDTSISKIGFIGLRITNGFLTHGISINYNNNISAFKHINPCGLGDITITSVYEINSNIHNMKNNEKKMIQHENVDIGIFKNLLAKKLQKIF